MMGMRKQMEANTNEMKNGMKDEMKTMRGEMQRMGLNLRASQKAIMAVARDQTRNMGRGLQAGIKAMAGELKMATPRAVTNELGGECNGCQARGGGG